MKKCIFWLSVLMIILAAVITTTVASNNIAAVISLSQENEDSDSSLQININTASAKELTAIPGIGENLAREIVAHRRKNGPYHSVEDMLDVKGIGPSTYNKIADYLTVGG